MVRITEELLRRRAWPAGETGLATVRELALHSLGIERIEYIGSRCRGVKVLMLQNNVIARLENLGRLKDLEYLNVAINNITTVQGLDRCESLAHLDISLNFVPVGGLAALADLAALPHLRRLSLLGNPCARWKDYRPFVISTLPKLEQLDGREVTPDERTAALSDQERLQESFEEALTVLDDPEDVPLLPDGTQTWSIETRLQDAREREAREAARALPMHSAESAAPRLTRLPALPDGCTPLQKNQGGWRYRFVEEDGYDGRTSNDLENVLHQSRSSSPHFGPSLRMEIELPLSIASQDIDLDVQPCFVRLLAEGHLLQVLFPEEVCADRATAQRSKASGRLVLSLPKRQARAFKRCGGPSTKHRNLPRRNLCCVAAGDPGVAPALID